MKFRLCMILAIAAFSASLYGVSLLPGSQNVYNGTGAGEIGRGYTGISELGSLEGNTFNPASLGDIRRMANSLLIGGVGTSGLLFESGFAYPSDWGVFSINGLFTGGSAPNSLKSLAGAQIQIAKPITENLFWGTGIKFYYGTGTNTDTQIGLDMGAIWRNPSTHNGFGFLDPSYGVVIKNIGKLMDLGASDPFPGMGLGIGASFLPVKFNAYKLKILSDLSVPVYPFNIVFNAGIENIFFDMFKIKAGYTASTDNSGLAGVGPFQFGAGFIGKIKLKDSTDIELNYALQRQTFNGKEEWAHSIGASVAWGYYDELPPAVKIKAETNYFSPNFDGLQDTAHLKLLMQDNKMVDGWEVTILNSNKNSVKTFKSLEKLQVKNLSFTKFFTQILAKKQQVDIPSEVVWNGQDEKGAKQPDGDYYYVLRAWDENKNESQTQADKITIDMVVRKISATPSYTIFAPKGDTKKQVTFKIQSEAIVRGDRITVTVTGESNNVVKTFNYADSAPNAIIWDGKDNQSNVVKQGVYQFKIAVESLSGVKTVTSVDGIKVITTYPKLDIQQNAAVFSPSINNFAIFKQNVSDQDGLETWTLRVYDANGNVVREFKGEKSLPPEIVWDGRNNAGAKLPDQIYTYDLMLVYDNGNTPQTDKKAIEIDSTPATVSIKPDYLSFSPIEGSKQRIITFSNIINGKDEDQIELKILDPVGNTVYYDKMMKKNLPAVFTWNGLDKDLKPLPEGKYSYVLDTLDKAGNKSTARIDNIMLRTGKEKVSAQSDVSAFSPMGNSAQKQAVFAVDGSKDAVDEYEFDVRIGDKIIRKFEANQFQDKIVWDGKDDSGISVPDGVYLYSVRVKYNNGQEPVSSLKPIRVDNAAPSIDVSAADLIFSPNGISKKQTFAIKENAKGDSSDTYDANFIDATGKAVRSFNWTGEIPNELIWDGKDDKNTALPEGTYIYTIKGIDSAKNYAVRTISNIQLIRTVPVLALNADTTAFSPNGKIGAKQIQFTASLSTTNLLQQSIFTILDNNGKAVKKSVKNGTFDSKIIWDGKNDNGIYVSEGYYTAEMAASFASGNDVKKSISNIALDRNPPDVKLTVSPDLFSPDGDGDQDLLYINMEISDFTGVSNWQIGIYKKTDDGKEGPLFKSFSGKGETKQLIEWDGTGNDPNDTVESVQDYVLDLEAVDGFGNKTNVTRIVPVGVLVERTPDGLKIRVSSIRFALNKADLVGDSKKTLDKIIYIIRKILSDPKKYGITENYKIEVSGHTDDLQGPTPDFNQKLSEKRAKAVYDYLISQDIEPKILDSIGYGETRPYKVISSDMTKDKKDEYRARNRRVEFFIRK